MLASPLSSGWLSINSLKFLVNMTLPPFIGQTGQIKCQYFEEKLVNEKELRKQIVYVFVELQNTK